jgi:hypothetical protein
MSAQPVIEMPAEPGQQLERKATSLCERAQALRIHDQQTYDSAVEFLKGVKALRKEAADHHKPVVEAAFAAHKAAVAALNRIDEPLEQAERAVKGYIAAWDTEQERIRRVEQERLMREMEAARERELEAALEQAEANGASAAEVEAIIDQQAYVPAPTVVSAPRYTQASGISTRAKWTAAVVDLPAFVRACAANPAWIYMLSPNMPAINALVRAQAGAVKIPGLRVTQDSTVAVRI